MTLPTSRLAYQDCYDAFDRAVADRRGIRISMADQDQATYYRMRLNQARKIDRRENTKIYQPGDALYGCSAYDCIVIRLLPEADENGNLTGAWWLYLQKQEIIPGIVESLSEDEDEPSTPMAAESNPRSATSPLPESLNLGDWDEGPADGQEPVDDAETESGLVQGETNQP